MGASNLRKRKKNILIDIQNNRPITLNKSEKPTTRTGTSIEITLIGDYFRSIQKIQEYQKQI